MHVVYVPVLSAPAQVVSGTSIVVQLAIGDGLRLQVETLTAWV